MTKRSRLNPRWILQKLDFLAKAESMHGKNRASVATPIGWTSDNPSLLQSLKLPETPEPPSDCAKKGRPSALCSGLIFVNAKPVLDDDKARPANEGNQEEDQCTPQQIVPPRKNLCARQ